MKRSYPSLSGKGWIDDVPGVLDSVMANFMLTHPSLSVEYNGAIIALPDIIKQWGNDETAIQREITGGLERLLTRWFDNPVVEARVTYPNVDDDTRMNVSVYMSIQRDGQDYNVARELAVINGKVVNVMEINNNG